FVNKTSFTSTRVWVSSACKGEPPDALPEVNESSTARDSVSGRRSRRRGVDGPRLGRTRIGPGDLSRPRRSGSAGLPVFQGFVRLSKRPRGPQAHSAGFEAAEGQRVGG